MCNVPNPFTKKHLAFFNEFLFHTIKLLVSFIIIVCAHLIATVGDEDDEDSEDENSTQLTPTNKSSGTSIHNNKKYGTIV